MPSATAEVQAHRKLLLNVEDAVGEAVANLHRTYVIHKYQCAGGTLALINTLYYS